MDEDGVESFNDVYIVTDYYMCHMGNIFEMIKGDSFTVDHALTITYNLLSSINFLHTANVWHRSIEPDKILITNACNFLITDFGMART